MSAGRSEMRIMRAMIIGWLVVSALLLVPTAHASPVDKNIELCIDTSTNPDARIDACTWLLRSGKVPASTHFALIIRGNIWLDRHEFDNAIADYTQALSIKPDDVEALNRRGLSWREKGEIARAIADFDHALTIAPDFAEAFNNRGMAWSNLGEYDKAIADFSRAVSLRPGHVAPLTNRGTAWRNKGEFDKAIVDFDHALAISPGDTAVLINRGNAWRDRGDLDKAIADYTQAISIDAADTDAMNNRGVAWLDKGEYERAIADYSLALRIKPDFAEAFANRGFAWQVMRNFRNAVADYEAAISLDPHDPDALNRLARLRATAPDPAYRNGEEAVRLAERALKIVQKAYIADTLGAAHVAAGNPEAAAAAYERAMTLGQRETVIEYQEHLKAYGCYDGPIDGNNEPRLKRALRKCVRKGVQIHVD